MANYSNEMSAEEMTEAMSVEEELAAPNSASAAGSKELAVEMNATKTKAESSQDSLGEAASIGNSVPVENTLESDTAKPLPVNVNPIIKFTDKDALDLAPYIEKYVKVELVRNCSYVGFIHSIDPITHSIILSVPKEDMVFQTVLIPGASVVGVTEVPLDSNITPPVRKPVQKINTDDDETRKKRLISWLKDNHLPVTEEGENIVFSGVTVLPPYGEKDICTTNPLIALEIRKIINRMPDDYEPK